GVMIHSDQGGHYTNPTYVNKLKDLGVIQSMSRRGNCLDNAKMETFFDHFKDECPFFKAKSYEDIVKKLSDYMYYYNNQRYQWRLKKMAPVQYRNHLLSA
ncbi:MAG: IS3 family transposase, partial [Bacilli bacterium]|nr:IS3 family transposase [Bacilli bacterium]